MSVEMMTLVWKASMKRDLKFVLLAYADHADDDGANIFPAVSTIMRKTDYSERSVQVITKKLLSTKYLIEDGEGPHGTNRWKMNVDLLTKSTGVQKLRGAKKRKKSSKGGAESDAQTAPDSSFNPSFNAEPSKDEAALPPDPLAPATPQSLRMFEVINRDRDAKGQNAMKRFGSVQQREQTETALVKIDAAGELEAAFDWAMLKGRHARDAFCGAMVNWAKNLGKPKPSANGHHPSTPTRSFADALRDQQKGTP